ncbi:MAG: FHA domain-containing protein [Deltaproteobacteria bacterium]|nr:FHA domain-containing protein [Deltaproteobacteria bacterium]
MPRLLTHYTVRILRGEPVDVDCPVLIWSSAPAETSRVLLATAPHQSAQRPRAGEPVVFELRKGADARNAFAMGVTVGRTDSNDVWLDDESVSRFHAYFQSVTQRGTTVWQVVDAESMNGTFLNTFKLPANKAESLRDGDALRFGDVEVRFLLPEGFRKHLETPKKA